VQVPLPALLPREPEEADSTRPRIEDLKAITPVFPEEAAIKEQPAAETAVLTAALRTPDVTATQPGGENLHLRVPPNRAYSLAYLAVFAGAALLATGRALGSRTSGFAR
jgi:hypothetical protein